MEGSFNAHTSLLGQRKPKMAELSLYPQYTGNIKSRKSSVKFRLTRQISGNNQLTKLNFLLPKQQKGLR